jgi:membrane-bound lytic murein transglycosylase D
VKKAIRAVMVGAGALVLAGCASTSNGPQTTATVSSGSWDAAPAGKEHYQFAPLPPAETIAQDLGPTAPRSQEEILTDAELQFQSAKEAQDLGDDARTYEHFSAMMDRLVEAKLDPETFARVRDGYTTQLTAGVTMLGIYERNQTVDLDNGPVLDAQVDGTVTVHERVQAEIEAIQRVYPKSFQAGLDRSYKYLPYVRARFAEAGLPEDLVWLAMVESQFTPKIDSRAGAGGMWQFMRGTARRYGMHIDGYVDDRYDWRRATNAAVQYLSELYAQFDGNWPLAVTAYNMGEGGLGRTIKNAGGEDNLWDLLETKAGSSRIKLESKRFYAKLLATVIVAKNPEQYGFERRPQPAEEAEALKVRGFYSLAEIEKQSGLEQGSLARLNPQFVRGYTPPARDTVLAVPVQHNTRVRTVLASMPELRPGTHTVQRGETLSQIAAAYHVSVSELQSTNSIKSPKSLRAGQKLVIPGGAPIDSGSDVVAASASGAKTYTVLRGDSLSGIAGKYRVSVKDLQRWNNLGSRTTIRAGQSLVVAAAPASKPVSTPAAVAKTPPSAPASSVKTAAATETKYHTVKKGDYPDKIARAYGVKLDDLLQWNGLTKRSTIQIGQKLKVNVPVAVAKTDAPAPAAAEVAKATPTATKASARTHTVRRGETVSSISKKYGVSTREVLAWNGLTAKSVLQIGDVLKVQSPVAAVASAPTTVKSVRVADSGTGGTVRHIHAVASGENPSVIAEHYAVPVETLFEWNGWTTAPTLTPGDEVVVFQPALPQD